MAELSKSHETMLRRHRPAMARFAAATKVPLEELAFVVAAAGSRVGRATTQSGIITTARLSFVIPVTVNDIPRFLEVVGAAEIEALSGESGAVRILIIDADDRPVVLRERLMPAPQRTGQQNRSIISSDSRDRG